MGTKVLMLGDVTRKPESTIKALPNRCNCENSDCKEGHQEGDCTKVALIPTIGGKICGLCARYMPHKYYV